MRGFPGVVMLFAMGLLALFCGLVPLCERIELGVGLALLGAGVFAYRLYRRTQVAR